MVEHHKVERKRGNEVRNSLMVTTLASQFCFIEAVSSCLSFTIANLFPLAVFAVLFHRPITYVNFFFFFAVSMFVFCQMTSYVAYTILSLGDWFDPLIDYAAGDVADVKAAWPCPVSDVHFV